MFDEYNHPQDAEILTMGFFAKCAGPVQESGTNQILVFRNLRPIQVNRIYSYMKKKNLFGKSCWAAQLFWASFLVCGGSVINGAYPV